MGEVPPWKRIEGSIPPSEYEHLTEEERMMRGYPYHPADEDLLANFKFIHHIVKERLKARLLTKEFDSIVPTLSPEGDKRRKEILKELFHPDSDTDTLYIEPPLRVDYGSKTIFGKNCFVNFNLCILDSALVQIGDRCQIAPGVQIYTATHPIDPIRRREYELAKPITIGNDVWIGGNAVILPGVTIGDAVVIGGGAVVTKDIPGYCVVGGNPARIIKKLDGFRGE